MINEKTEIKNPRYLSGGRLGDFIQQLSIVYEKYLENKVQAIIYISEHGDIFRFGIEKAYHDLYPIISTQSYILEFKIHNNEPYDVNLCEWRNEHCHQLFTDIIYNIYNVNWAKHRWIHNIPTDEKWADYVIINTTKLRFPSTINWNEFLLEHEKKTCLFVSLGEEEHKYFTEKCFDINYYKPKSLLEFYIIINSCKLFVGSFSSPLSMAFSIHAKCIVGFGAGVDMYYEFNSHNIPNVKKFIQYGSIAYNFTPSDS